MIDRRPTIPNFVHKPTRFRVIDLETTGTTANDAVVEIAAVDLVGDEIVLIGSDLVRPPIPIPPESSAIHHVTDDDVIGSPTLEEVLPAYVDADRAAGVDVFVAHRWAFERQWLGDHLRGRPAICTYKASVRVWPDAPTHSNQGLRYWLRPKGFRSELASPAHRALPDAWSWPAFVECLGACSVTGLAAPPVHSGRGIDSPGRSGAAPDCRSPR